MDRLGTLAFLVGLAIAFVGSLPFVASVIGGVGSGEHFAGSLAWQAWAVGGAIAFVGVGLFAATDRALPHGHHGHG